MKNIRRFIVFIAALLTATMLGCASSPRQESTGQYIDDSVITSKVKAAILEEPSLKSLEVSVETYKGQVQLSGFVSSADSIAKATEIARSVKGVTSVKNSLVVKK